MKWLSFTRRRGSLDDLHETLELTVKAGRRCAHDLDHAADEIRDAEQREFFRQRARMWLAIFYPDKGPKNYRAELHLTISRLEGQVARLRSLCDEHGIDHNDPDGIPF
ncbi:hypothetical protein ABIC83_002772 [Roseateles asaccharophilus]|uniref:hypothetical protein n=1 Tax=Roseateles asaccharophilus TaxID=582607 RepID=UPI0038326BBD